MAMSTSVQEVKWIKQLLGEMGCHIQLPISVHTDNQAAQSMSRVGGVPHSRTQHIDLRHHYVRECVEAGWVSVKWVGTSEQLADVFTKALGKQTFRQRCNGC